MNDQNSDGPQTIKYFHASQVKLPVNSAVRDKMLVKNKGTLVVLRIKNAAYRTKRKTTGAPEI